MIPVILPQVGDTPRMPSFLIERQWVDLRYSETKGVDELVMAIDHGLGRLENT